MLKINPFCTYLQTQRQYREQEWASCLTCFQSEQEGACLSCLSKCHRGHMIGSVRYSNFFCDCGDQQKCTEQISSTSHTHPRSPGSSWSSLSASPSNSKIYPDSPKNPDSLKSDSHMNPNPAYSSQLIIDKIPSDMVSTSLGQIVNTVNCNFIRLRL